MGRSDVRDWYQRMKPPLDDPDFLWGNIDSIDVVETDHAPHTIEEKEFANQVNPLGNESHSVKSYGVPGLEAVVPLMVSAVVGSDDPKSPFYKHQLDGAKLEQLLVYRPREILGQYPRDDSTYVKVQIGDYIFGEDDIYSKCGWSLYTDWPVKAKVAEVCLRGSVIYRYGAFYGTHGRILRSHYVNVGY
jgi:dihydroorotase